MTVQGERNRNDNAAGSRGGIHLFHIAAGIPRTRTVIGTRYETEFDGTWGTAVEKFSR
jgi:hypothetical protein